MVFSKGEKTKRVVNSNLFSVVDMEHDEKKQIISLKLKQSKKKKGKRLGGKSNQVNLSERFIRQLCYKYAEKHLQ